MSNSPKPKPPAHVAWWKAYKRGTGPIIRGSELVWTGSTTKNFKLPVAVPEPVKEAAK